MKRVERLEPVDIDEHSWYYEEARGINVVHEIKENNGAYYRTDQFLIPWKRLLESVKRKYDKKTLCR